MPKLKISKTVKERFKITGKGKILHLSGGLKHRRSKERANLSFRGGGLRKLATPERKKFEKILGI
jgi:ribosomal protein L35